MDLSAWAGRNLRQCYGRMMRRRTADPIAPVIAAIAAFAAIGSALMPSAAHAARPQILFAQGSWAALKFGGRCEAAARPVLPGAQRQPAARAGFGFGEPGRWGEFHVRLSRVRGPARTSC